jgi:hypothetical protein
VRPSLDAGANLLKPLDCVLGVQNVYTNHQGSTRNHQAEPTRQHFESEYIQAVSVEKFHAVHVSYAARNQVASNIGPAFLVDQATASDLAPPAIRLVLPTFLPPQQHLPHLVDNQQREHLGGHWGSGHSLSDTSSIDDTARSLHKF